MPNILNFNDNGGATIKIPQIQKDYPFVVNHFTKPSVQLLEIERDIPLADTDERREFLIKYKTVLEEFIVKSPVLEEFFCDFDDEEDDEFQKAMNYEEEADFIKKNPEYKDVIFDFGDEEEETEDEYDVLSCEENEITVYNYQLKRSLAWYLLYRLKNEIINVEKHIEGLHSVLRLVEEDLIIDFITTIRETKSEAELVEKLMGKFVFSKTQASFLTNMKLNELTGASLDSTKETIVFYNEVKSFLEELKK